MLRGWRRPDTSRSIRENSEMRSLRKDSLAATHRIEQSRFAKEQEERGHAYRTGKFIDEMRRHFRLVGEEIREKLLQILDEIPPESYQPPRKLEEPPGCPFIFPSGVLGREVFFKSQIAGTTAKPMVVFWSCHPPLYG